VFTVVGASGFVGRAVVELLRARREEVRTPTRAEISHLTGDFGHVVYAAGITKDAGNQPLETMEAHVGLLTRLLRTGGFRSLLYLSSSGVYLRARAGDEACDLPVNPTDGSQLYNISKVAGEALCLAVPQDTVRVVRLSSVYASDRESPGFLGEILKEAISNGHLRLRTALDSARDYVSLADVVELVPRIATLGRARLYNVASGSGISHRQLVDALGRHLALTVEVEAGAPRVAYPAVSIQRIREEFDFEPRRLLADLASVVGVYLTRYGRR
jgi:nucleoside-diphosphate-sugar epimerase